MIFFLVGYMGSGKSSISRTVASKTGLPLTDTDREIERRAGMDIFEIFNRKGEEWFREQEKLLVEEICRCGGDRIVSTGGGTPCHDSLMGMMNDAGKTIYLKMSPANLAYRIRPGQLKRPRLVGIAEGELEKFIAADLAGREEVYLRASMTIDCDGVSDRYIAGHIEEYIRFVGGTP